MKFLGQCFQKLDHEQYREHDRCDWMQYCSCICSC